MCIRDSNETWNGTSWSEVANLTAAKTKGAAAGQSSTSALVFGGNPRPAVGAQTEKWNGTAWTELNDLNTSRREMGGAGIVAAALAMSGEISTITTATEEWSEPNLTVKTVDVD